MSSEFVKKKKLKLDHSSKSLSIELLFPFSYGDVHMDQRTS